MKASDLQEIALQEEPPPLSRRTEVVALMCVFGLAAVLRMMDLGRLQLSGAELQQAWNMMAREETASLGAIRDMVNTVVSSGPGQPMLGPLLLRWMWFLPFGNWFDWSPQFLRFAGAMAGLLTIPMVWAAARAMSGPRHGIAAAFLMAVCPIHVWASRNVGVDVLLGLELSATLWFLFAKQFDGRPWRSPVVGILCGAIISTAVGGMLLAPFLVAASVVTIGDRARAALLRHTLTVVAVMIVLWCLLCDPAAYLDLLVQHIRAGAWSNAFLPLLLLAPGTMLAGLIAGAVMLRERRSRADLALWLVLLGSLPLLSMTGGGPTSCLVLLPLMIVASLLSARIVELPRPMSDVLLGLHGLLAMLPLNWFVAGFLTMAAPAEIRTAATVDPFYEAARPWLFDRENHPVVLAHASVGEMDRKRSDVLKSVSLAEGAVVMAAGNLYYPAIDCKFADAVVAEGASYDDSYGPDLNIPSCLQETTGHPSEWINQAKPTPDSFGNSWGLSELEEVESRGGWRILQIPGHWIPVTGGFMLEWKDGKPLTPSVAVDPSAVSPVLLRGSESGTTYIDRICIPIADEEEIVVRFVAPGMTDAVLEE